MTQPLAGASRLRFGISASRKHAPRAVARNMLKRVLREAARHHAPALLAAAGAARLDILFRLKSPLPSAPDLSWSALKSQLRGEADGLLDQLARRLPATAGAAGSLQRPPLAQSAPAGAAGAQQ
jgi:ribonuclease P protein component